MRYTVLILIMLLCAAVNVHAHDENGYIIQADVNDERLVYVSEENVISRELGIYIVDDEAELEAFRENYSVEKYEPDVELELFDVPNDMLYSQRWDASAVKLPDMWDYELKLDDIDVAILDTGIASGHEDFDYDRVEGIYNMCAARKIMINGGNVDSPINKKVVKNVEDDIGHGTAVAGIIAAKRDNLKGVFGVADGVNLNIYKVFSEDCVNASCILMALSAIYEENPEVDVINISIGLTVGDIMQDVIDRLAERGVIIVAAAGNDGDDVLVYPAGCDNVIGVGAINSEMTVASFSQRNKSIDVVAPGQDLYSTLSDNSYGNVDGTSFSSPYVAALAAIAKAVDSDIDHDGFMELLIQTASDSGVSGYDVNYGYGIVQPSRMLDVLADEHGVSLLAEDDVVTEVEQSDTGTVFTVKRRYRNFEVYAAEIDENGVITNVQKRIVYGGDGECIVEFDGAADVVYWWDKSMRPLF